jgi:hypothetical protein
VKVRYLTTLANLFSRRNIKKNVSRKDIILRILSYCGSKFTGGGGGRTVLTGNRSKSTIF